MSSPTENGRSSRLRPADRRRLRERVVGIIVDALRSGEYSEGDRLPSERELADRMGVSRTMVSDAIDELQALGVLESRRGRGGGTFVVSVSELPARGHRLPGERRDVMAWLLEARHTVEVAVVTLAAERARVSDVREMRKLYEAMSQLLDDPPAYAEAAMRFNLRIASASGNPFLSEFVRQLVNEQATLRLEFSAEPSTDELRHISLATHAELLAAMMDGDPERIERAVSAHIEGVREIYLGPQGPDDSSHGVR